MGNTSSTTKPIVSYQITDTSTGYSTVIKYNPNCPNRYSVPYFRVILGDDGLEYERGYTRLSRQDRYIVSRAQAIERVE